MVYVKVSMAPQKRIKKRAAEAEKKKHNAGHRFLRENRPGFRAIDEWKKQDTILILILVCAALALRLYGAMTHGFWMDEFGTIHDARYLKPKNFFEQVHFLSFFFVKLALALGEYEIVVRFPSLLFGILSIPLLYLFCWRFVSRETAIITSIFLVISPYHIHFSQEARYYTEIVFFSLCALYFLALFLSTRNPIFFVPSFIFGLLNIGIHPTTYIFFFSLILFTIVYFLFHVRFLEIVKYLKASPVLAVILLVSLLTVALFIGLMLGSTDLDTLTVSGIPIGNTIATILHRIAHFPNIEMTAGVSFSSGFFTRIFTHFPHHYGAGDIFVGMLFGFFFILGSIYLLIRKPAWITLFFWFTYLLTMSALFLFKAKIPYTDKYVIYLFPLYFIMVGSGFAFIYHILKTPERIRVLIVGLLMILISIPLVPAVYKLITREVCPYKSAVKYIAEQSKGEKFQVYASDAACAGMQYYVRRLGLEDVGITLYEEDMAVSPDENVWIATMFYVGTEEKILRFFDRLLETYYEIDTVIKAFPNERLWSIRLYRPRLESIIFPQNPFIKTIEKSDISALDTCTVELQPLVSGDYVCRCTFQETIDTDAIDFTFNDTYTTPSFIEDKSIMLETNLQQGINTLSIISSQKDTIEDFLPIKLNVVKGNKINTVPGYIYDSYKGVESPRLSFYNERMCLKARNNLTLSYDFGTIPEGAYLLSVEAVNDVPAPVILGIDVDGTIIGYLGYQKNDNEWSKKQITLKNYEKARRTFNITFLNGFAITDEEEKKRELFLGSLTLKNLTTEGGFVVDYNLRKELKFPKNLEAIDPSFESSAAPGVLSDFWRFVTRDAQYKWDTMEGHRVMEIHLPAMSEGVDVKTIEFPLDGANAIYFSVWVKTINLLNHSANIYLQCFDKDGKEVVRHWLNTVGITGNSDWQKLYGLRILPPSAASAAIYISTYKNSVQPGSEEQTVLLHSPSFSAF